MDVLLRRAEEIQRALHAYLAPNESLRARVMPGFEVDTEGMRMFATVQHRPPQMIYHLTKIVDSMESRSRRLKADVEARGGPSNVILVP